MILSRISIYVMAYRCQPNRMLLAWLQRARDEGAEWSFAPEVLGVDLAREVVCNRFLAEREATGRDHLIMVDADMAPDAESDPILTEGGDLLYCGYAGHQGTRGHVGDGDFGCALCRISADLLAAVPKPWFRLRRAGDLQDACECQFFATKAKGLGFVPRQAGRCWHCQTILIRPTPDGAGLESQWPRAIEHGQ